KCSTDLQTRLAEANEVVTRVEALGARAIGVALSALAKCSTDLQTRLAEANEVVTRVEALGARAIGVALS
ncbi:hypothetical protein C0U43_28825, partial [Klebsiella pneumoniae]